MPNTRGQCPYCGSQNITFQLRDAGTRSKTNYYRTGVRNSWVLPAGQKRYRSKRQQKSVGLCQSCGYSWDAYSEKGCLFYLLCVVFFPISLSVWFYRSNPANLPKLWRVVILVIAWVLFCLFSEWASTLR